MCCKESGQHTLLSSPKSKAPRLPEAQYATLTNRHTFCFRFVKRPFLFDPRSFFAFARPRKMPRSGDSEAQLSTFTNRHMFCFRLASAVLSGRKRFAFLRPITRHCTTRHCAANRFESG